MTDTNLLALLAAWGAFCTAALSPGPNMVAIASRALGSGRQSALYVTLGISIGALAWSALTAFGLSALFEAYPKLLQVLAVCGGTYLFWMGYKGLRAAALGGKSNIAPSESSSLSSDFLHGLLVTATNPKVGMFWASLSTVINTAAPSWPTLIIFALGASLLAFAIYGSYGLIFSTTSLRTLYGRFERHFEALFGLVFCTLGTSLMVFWGPF